jgi:hypothetical protein
MNITIPIANTQMTPGALTAMMTRTMTMTSKTPEYTQGAQRGLQAGFILGAFVMSMLLALIWPDKAHAEPVDEPAPVFLPWRNVTPLTMLQPLPEWRYAKENFGAVQPKHIGKPTGCPLVEDGRVTGWSLTCEGKN